MGGRCAKLTQQDRHTQSQQSSCELQQSGPQHRYQAVATVETPVQTDIPLPLLGQGNPSHRADANVQTDIPLSLMGQRSPFEKKAPLSDDARMIEQRYNDYLQRLAPVGELDLLHPPDPTTFVDSDRLFICPNDPCESDTLSMSLHSYDLQARSKVFDRRNYAHPSLRSVHDDAPQLELGIRMIYICAACILIYFAIKRNSSAHVDARHKVELIACAMLCLIVGVALPWRASQLVSAVPLRWFATVSHLYKSRHGATSDALYHYGVVLGQFRLIANTLRYAGHLFGFSALLITVIAPSLEIAAAWLAVGWIFVTLFFSSAVTEEVALASSSTVVLCFIEDMRAVHHEAQWGLLSAKYRILGQMLVHLWSIECIGGLVVLRMLCLFAVSLGIGVLGVNHPHLSTRLLYILAGTLLALGASLLLLRLARVTARCTSSDSESILTCAHSIIGTTISTAVAAHDFLALLSASPIGVQICGIPITSALLLKLALRSVLYIPAIFTACGQMLHQREGRI